MHTDTTQYNHSPAPADQARLQSCLPVEIDSALPEAENKVSTRIRWFLDGNRSPATGKLKGGDAPAVLERAVV